MDPVLLLAHRGPDRSMGSLAVQTGKPKPQPPLWHFDKINVSWGWE